MSEMEAEKALILKFGGMCVDHITLGVHALYLGLKISPHYIV